MTWVSYEATPGVTHLHFTFSTLATLFSPIFHICHTLHCTELDFQHLPCISYTNTTFCTTCMTFTRHTRHCTTPHCTVVLTAQHLPWQFAPLHCITRCSPHLSPHSQHYCTTLPQWTHYTSHLLSIIPYLSIFASLLNTLGHFSIYFACIPHFYCFVQLSWVILDILSLFHLLFNLLWLFCFVWVLVPLHTLSMFLAIFSIHFLHLHFVSTSFALHMTLQKTFAYTWRHLHPFEEIHIHYLIPFTCPCTSDTLQHAYIFSTHTAYIQLHFLISDTQ